MPESLPAITIWQPWATLIAAGAKPHEFRHWPAPQRLWHHRVAIHAGARGVRRRELQELLVELRLPSWRQTGLVREIAIPILERALQDPKALPLSSVLCTASLGKPIRNEDLSRAMGLPLIHDSDRDEHTNWGWPLTDIRVLEPYVPARGAQGWWTWTPEREAVHG